MKFIHAISWALSISIYTQGHFGSFDIMLVRCVVVCSRFFARFAFQKSRRAARPTTPHTQTADRAQRERETSARGRCLLRLSLLYVVRICFAWLIDTWYYQFEMFGNNFIIYSWPLYLISMVYHFVLFFNFDYWIPKNTVASILCICKYIQLFQKAYNIYIQYEIIDFRTSIEGIFC